MVNRTTKITCLICGSSQTRRSLSINGYEIYQCRCCSFAFVHPPIGFSEVEKVYDSPEYYGSSIAQRSRIEWDIQRRLRILAQLRPEKGRLLDIGCAAGYFLSAAMVDGWDVLGVERSLHTAKRAMSMVGDRIVISPLEKVDLQSQFDVICLWEFLEHTQDPVGVISKTVSLLAPCGIICLSTPNIGGLLAYLMGERFPAIIPPEHLSYFTGTSLKYLLKRFGLRKAVVKSFSNITGKEFYNGIIKYYLSNSKFKYNQVLRTAAYAIGTLLSPLIKLIDRLNLGSELEIYTQLSMRK